MTQAFNLSQFANKLNSSGQADLSSAATGVLPVANGGTGTSTPSLIGGTGISISGTFPNQTITNVSTSAYVGNRGQIFTNNGTFTIPTNVTAIKITVIGGGGGSGGVWGPSGPAMSGGGGGGGAAIKYLTGLTPGNTLSVTVGGGGAAGGPGSPGTNGGTGGTSSVSSGSQSIGTISATGGGGSPWAGDAYTNGGSGGNGSGGDLNLYGLSGIAATAGGQGGATLLQGNTPMGQAGAGQGGGAGGKYDGTGTNSYGLTGSSGIVIFEW